MDISLFCSLYLVFEHCMDSSLRSSLPHLTRWFTTVLGQNEVKEVLAGLNLKQCVPKGPATTVAPVIAPIASSSSGKGLAVVSPQYGNWHQNSQTNFVCLEPFDTFPLLGSWQQNRQICFVCSESFFATFWAYQPLPAYTYTFLSYLPCFCLGSPCMSLPFSSIYTLLASELHNFPKLQRQSLLPVQKPWKRLLLKELPR